MGGLSNPPFIHQSTIVSGFLDTNNNRIMRKFTGYYFCTPPAELLKTHFPTNTNWQLSSHTVDLETFYNTPIYFPSCFINDVKLVKNTKDTFFVSPNNEL